MESVNIAEMLVNGLTYREYFRKNRTLPEEAIEHLLDLYDFEEDCADCEQFKCTLREIADMASGY